MLILILDKRSGASAGNLQGYCLDCLQSDYSEAGQKIQDISRLPAATVQCDIRRNAECKNALYVALNKIREHS